MRSGVLPNWKNKTLYRRDNLDVLRGMNSETVDLIATDPPFNKGKDFHATPESLAAGAKFQDRWSWDDDVHQEWVDQIADDWPRVRAVIDAVRMTHSAGMGAFLCYIGVRLIEMRRVLKPTGSLYLHCDATASHYLKQLLDAVFGKHNFRDEVTWQRASGSAKGSQYAGRSFGRDVDSIFHYSASDVYVHNQVFAKISEEWMLKRFPLIDEDGRRYHTTTPIFRSLSMGDRPNLCYEYKGVRNPYPSGWRISRERLAQMDAEGRIIWREGKTPLRKFFADEYKGKAVGSLWIDIPNAMGKERTGYPTQKPLALYERIIRASSNEGDVVLDPFCGCATTLIAAERLNRQWVGVDIWDGAKEIVLARLRKESLVREGDDATSFFDERLTYVEGKPERTDEGHESVPFLPSKLKQREPPDPRMSRAAMVEILIERDGIRCQGCFRSFDHPSYLELDHIQPRAEGGSNAIDNRTLLCGPCNHTKSHRLTLSGLHEKNKQTGFMVQR